MRTPLTVHLRPLERLDARGLSSWALNPRFCSAAEWSADLDASGHETFQCRLIAEPPADLIRLGVLHDGELVGYVAIQGTEPARRELGFVIGDSHRWGRGLGFNAAQAGVKYAFDQLALGEIWAEAWAANGASVRILQRLGMREVDRGESGTYLGHSTHYRRFTMSASA